MQIDDKKAEDALRESEEMFRTLAEKSPNMIFINQRGTIKYVNSRCVELVGYSKEEFCSPDFDFRNLVAPEDFSAMHSNFKSHLNGVDVPPCEYVLIASDGRRLETIISTKLIKFDGQDAILGIVTDISGVKRMEEELLNMRKLESVGVLAGGIAHDFNNLLHVIMGNIALAKLYATSDGKSLKFLDEAETACTHARDLSNKLLTFSKGGEPIKHPARLGELLVKTARAELSGTNVEPRFEMPDEIPIVEIDEGQIKQVIGNILVNATEAMPKGGFVDISLQTTEISEDDRLGLAPGGYIVVTIEDKGVGIKKESLSKIFDPYFTTKSMGSVKGSGLGLAICHSIMKKHFGAITADSTSGKGTSIRLYLPTAGHEKENIMHAAQPSAYAYKVEHQGRVLVMDDEDGVLDMLKETLGFFGYDVECAKESEGTIAKYVRAKDSGNPFDAVILDLTIHGGMGGVETIRKLIHKDPSVKAVISTGYAQDPIMTEYADYGFVGSIAKPYNAKELKAKLEHITKIS